MVESDRLAVSILDYVLVLAEIDEGALDDVGLTTGCALEAVLPVVYAFAQLREKGDFGEVALGDGNLGGKDLVAVVGCQGVNLVLAGLELGC